MNGRNFLAEGIPQREWDIIQDAKREAERQCGDSLTNREFLVALCNDTRWRKK